MTLLATSYRRVLLQRYNIGMATDIQTALSDERLDRFGREWIWQLHDNRPKLFKTFCDEDSLLKLALGRQEQANDMYDWCLEHGESLDEATQSAMEEFIFVSQKGRYPF